MLRSIPKVMVGIDDRQIWLKDRLVVQRQPIRPHSEMRIWRIKADAHRVSLLTRRAAASRYSAALRVVRESPSITSCVTPVVLAVPPRSRVNPLEPVMAASTLVSISIRGR